MVSYTGLPSLTMSNQYFHTIFTLHTAHAKTCGLTNTLGDCCIAHAHKHVVLLQRFRRYSLNFKVVVICEGTEV